MNLARLFTLCGLPRWISGKEPACNAGDVGSTQVRKIPWRRKWQPTAGFLPGESCGQRRLAGSAHGVAKESDTTEHAHTFTISRFSCFQSRTILVEEE